VPTVFATAIIPNVPSLETLSLLHEQHDDLHIFDTVSNEQRHIVGVATNSDAWKWRDVESDAQFLYCGGCSADMKLLLVKVKYLRVANSTVFEFHRPAESFQYRSRGGVLELSGSEIADVQIHLFGNIFQNLLFSPRLAKEA